MDTPRHCSIARTLAVVGERWSLLVIREVALGVRRFEGIRCATGAPRAVLADRLRTLVDAGILERRRYAEPGSRSRDEYRLTPAGRELAPVLTALRQWGERHLADPQGPPPRVVHRGCGADVRVQHVCGAGHVLPDNGRELTLTAAPHADADADSDSDADSDADVDSDADSDSDADVDSGAGRGLR